MATFVVCLWCGQRHSFFKLGLLPSLLFHVNQRALKETFILATREIKKGILQLKIKWNIRRLLYVRFCCPECIHSVVSDWQLLTFISISLHLHCITCILSHAAIVPCCGYYRHIVPWGWHDGSFYTRMLPYTIGHSWWQQCHCHGHRWRMDDHGGRSLSHLQRK